MAAGKAHLLDDVIGKSSSKHFSSLKLKVLSSWLVTSHAAIPCIVHCTIKQQPAVVACSCPMHVAACLGTLIETCQVYMCGMSCGLVLPRM